MIETLLVVPCYNEARRLNMDAFTRYLDAHPGHAFLLVDDGSRDGTLAVLQQAAQARPEACFVLALERNAGKAEAVRQGMLAARRHRPKFAGFWDADLATPLDMAPEFAALLQARPALRLVMGSRVRLLGRRVERTFFRHYTGRCIATLISMILHLPVYDTQCGAKLFRCDALWEQVFAQPFVSRWLFDVEILARYKKQLAGSVHDWACELPLPEWQDVANSHLGLRDAPRILGALFRIWRAY